MQLLCVQRLHGGLTIGDTHEYDEPFAFDVDEAPYDYLVDVVEEFLGRPLPPIRQPLGRRLQPVRRPRTNWCAAPQADDGVWVITGPGGRGMTLGPAHRRTDRRPDRSVRGNACTHNDIQLAVLDMAGTTVADDGLVVSAFEAAATAAGLPADGPGTRARPPVRARHHGPVQDRRVPRAVRHRGARAAGQRRLRERLRSG